MTEILEKNGLVMATGGLQRPRDPAEDKYMLSKTLRPVRAANLNQPVSLGRFRPSTLDQGRMGSCAFASSAAAAFTTRNAARAKQNQSLDAQLPHFGYMYEKGREKPYDSACVAMPARKDSPPINPKRTERLRLAAQRNSHHVG